MINEQMKKKLIASEPVFGLSMRFNDLGIIEIIGADWDFLQIDMQHGTITMDYLFNMVLDTDTGGVIDFSSDAKAQ